MLIKHEKQVKKFFFKTEEVVLNDFISLKMLGYLKEPHNWKSKEQSRNFWTLLYVNKGTGLLHYNGKEYGYTYDTGWIFKPGSTHRFENKSQQRIELLQIGFSFETSKDVTQNLNSIAPSFSDLSGSHCILRELRALSSFFRQYTEKTAFKLKRTEIMELLAKMFYFVSSSATKPELSENLRNVIMTEKAKRYLEDNISRNVSVREVARLFYLSTQYFGDIFKNCAGMTLKEYHCALRMTEAKRLLEENQMNVTQIASLLGFDTMHYFSKRYKQFYSMSPSQCHKH